MKDTEGSELESRQEEAKPVISIIETVKKRLTEEGDFLHIELKINLGKELQELREQLKQREEENKKLKIFIGRTLQPIKSMSEYFQIQSEARKLLSQ